MDKDKELILEDEIYNTVLKRVTDAYNKYTEESLLFLAKYNHRDADKFPDLEDAANIYTMTLLTDIISYNSNHALGKVAKLVADNYEVYKELKVGDSTLFIYDFGNLLAC